MKKYKKNTAIVLQNPFIQKIMKKEKRKNEKRNHTNNSNKNMSGADRESRKNI